jgi:hypothetical protein
VLAQVSGDRARIGIEASAGRLPLTEVSAVSIVNSASRQLRIWPLPVIGMPPA